MSATASGATSYGYAAVSDVVTGGIATKTVAPTVLYKPGFPPGKTTAYADPVGSVTLQAIPTAGNPTQSIPMQFMFPASNSPDVDHSISDSVGASLLGGNAPSQGILFNTGGLSNAQLGSTLNGILTISASVQQGATVNNLFSGTVTFIINQNPTVDFAGGFIGPSPPPGFQTLTDAAGNTLLTLTNLPVIPFTVVGSTDFQLTIDESLQIGNENNPDFTAGTLLTRNIGVVGLFTAGASPVDRQGVQLIITETPEPGR